MWRGQIRMSTVKWVSDWTCPSVQCPMDMSSCPPRCPPPPPSPPPACPMGVPLTKRTGSNVSLSTSLSDWMSHCTYMEPSTHIPQCSVSSLRSCKYRFDQEKGFDWKYLILWDLLCRMREQTFRRGLTIKIYHSRTFLSGKSGLRQQFNYISIFFVWLG